MGSGQSPCRKTVGTVGPIQNQTGVCAASQQQWQLCSAWGHHRVPQLCLQRPCQLCQENLFRLVKP